jgi:hypothetical protein
MTGEKFRARAKECLMTAHSVDDPARKLALMDAAQRWMRLADEIAHFSTPPKTDAAERARPPGCPGSWS